MPQFDVHRNNGRQSDSIPFVVVVQSTQFDRYRRRVVVPLALRAKVPAGPSSAGTRMNPIFRIDGLELILHPLDIVSVAIDQLGAPVASLADHGQQINDALDELLTRSWG